METRLLIRYFTAVTCLVIILDATLANRQPEGHVAMFVFGDSLYDPGNNNYINTTTSFQANFPPYGQSYFRVPTGRFSDGRLIPDFISNISSPYSYLILIKCFIPFIKLASWVS